jgi:hypothetical protein
VQVGVHARLEHGNATEFVEFGGVGFVVERAGDQHVEVGIAGLSRRGHEVGSGDGAELRTDEDSGSLLDLPFEAAPLANEIAGPRNKGSKTDPVLFVGLLDSRGPLLTKTLAPRAGWRHADARANG